MLLEQAEVVVELRLLGPEVLASSFAVQPRVGGSAIASISWSRSGSQTAFSCSTSVMRNSAIGFSAVLLRVVIHSFLGVHNYVNDKVDVNGGGVKPLPVGGPFSPSR